MKRILTQCWRLSAAFVLLGIGACSGVVVGMAPVADRHANFVPQPGKAMVVFLRPSTRGFGVQASVFDLREDFELVGVLANKKKVAYQAEPGRHLFVVLGENTNYLSAHLRSGKTYYVVVEPSAGLVKSRFSLRPISRAETQTDAFRNWLHICEWVAKNADSDKWAAERMDELREKHFRYLPEWQAIPLDQRAHLGIDEGV